jgi:hypothetical protein
VEPLQGTLTVRRQLVVEDPGSRVRVKPPKSHNGVRTLVLDPGTLELLGPVAVGRRRGICSPAGPWPQRSGRSAGTRSSI